jgi:tetratricopeptide (TPR) repeat protein
MRRFARILLAIVVLALASTSHAAIDLARVNPASVATCDGLVMAHPNDLEAYRCYLLIARRHQYWNESVRRLEALLNLDANNHAARLFLGAVEADRFRPRAESLLLEAAEGFAKRNDATGEVRARLNLANYLLRQGRVDDAEAETDVAGEVADTSGDLELVALADLQRAWNAFQRDDYSTAWTLFRKLGADLVPDGPAQGWERSPGRRGATRKRSTIMAAPSSSFAGWETPTRSLATFTTWRCWRPGCTRRGR